MGKVRSNPVSKGVFNALQQLQASTASVAPSAAVTRILTCTILIAGVISFNTLLF